MKTPSGPSHIENLVERRRRASSVEQAGAIARPIDSIGVIGVGMMGAGITSVGLAAGYRVCATDTHPPTLARAEEAIVARATHLPEHFAKRFVEQEGESPLTRLTLTNSLKGLADCDLVIETVVEKPGVKHEVYAEIEPRMRPDAILSSNTSTIRMSVLTRGLARPHRFCGLHFCTPLEERPLLEIIPGEATNEATVASAVVMAQQLGMLPMVVADSPGFVVNRITLAYLNSAIELLNEGVPARDIEQAANEFGMHLSPVTTMDVIGLDTVLLCAMSMWDLFRERMVRSLILTTLIRAGRLGRKVGGGFFPGSDPSTDYELDPATASLLAPHVGSRGPASREEVTDRLFLPLLLEAIRVVDEGVARSPGDMDLTAVIGLGFPREKGGPMYWADTLGPRQIIERLAPYQQLGKRYEPPPRLVEMAEKDSRFFDE